MRPGPVAWMLAVLLGVAAAGAVGSSPPGAAPSAVPAAVKANNLAVIPINREIDALMVKSVKRRIEAATAAGADALVFEIDSPGGELGAVLEICNLIKRAAVSNTVAWVNDEAYSGGAIIALACRQVVVAPHATLGDALIVSVNSFGFYERLDEQGRQKVLAPLLAEVVDSARLNGYDERLVQGLVVRGVDLYLIRHEATGQQLFVGAEEYRELFGADPPRGQPTIPSAPSAAGAAPEAPPARAPGAPDPAGAGPAAPAPTDFQPAVPGLSREVIDAVNIRQDLPSNRPRLSAADRGEWRFVEVVSDGHGVVVLKSDTMRRYGIARAVVRDTQELRQYFGAANLARLPESWSERMVVGLTNPIVRAVLIVVMLVAIFLTMVHPGTVVAELVFVLAIGLLLAPPALNNMASWWEVAAILGGILLLALEVFVLPGFGFFGVAGLLLLLGGMLGTFVTDTGGLFPGTEAGRSQLVGGVTTLLVSLVTAFVAMYFIGKHFGSIPVLNRLVLTDQRDDEPETGVLEAMGTEPAGLEVGSAGVALTPLRPAGRVQVGDQIFDVVAELGFIPAGAPVRVSSVTPFRIAVEPAPGPAAPRPTRTTA